MRYTNSIVDRLVVQYTYETTRYWHMITKQQLTFTCVCRYTSEKAKKMGNCLGSPIKVGDFTTPPPPNYDWKEIYDNLKTILCESYGWAAGLKHNFANKEVPNSTIQNMVENRVAEYSMLIVMSNKEAKQRAEDTNKILVR
ncbi:Hypothetical predicted protein [Mytilus galloprovincialis]|uniref:Uncharacterized protein n=1 Tax=Mytilus galloprovincialis TaxID=29158 RepID=A0A8B6GIM1_MYTGA|nr:Hypothetical predicted protein [Mytilus galloprovincialis]